MKKEHISQKCFIVNKEEEKIMVVIKRISILFMKE